MIFDQGEENLNAWKTEMRAYQKGKRTKIPFGRSVPQVHHVTYEQVKMKESLFNPVLQTYQRKEDEAIADHHLQQKRTKSLLTHFKNTAKYQKNFDIVNLHSNSSQPSVEGPSKKLGPIRNAYNVINNQKLPDFYFKNRDLRLPQEREKKLIPTHQKQFNIVTNVYKEDNEQRVHAEQEKEKESIMNKYWKTHNYDPVYGKFYSEEKEHQYQEQLHKQQEEHGKDNYKKYPPSYIHREPFISDFTKPLPQTLRALDEKYAAAKKRFQLKYIVQDEYEKRNVEQEVKQEQILKNHVHFGRVLDQKTKQFDIITNKPYQPNRAEELFGKKIEVSSWDQLIRQTQQEQQKLAASRPSKLIKTGGFNA